jgi:hypothetical protein
MSDVNAHARPNRKHAVLLVAVHPGVLSTCSEAESTRAFDRNTFRDSNGDVGSASDGNEVAVLGERDCVL